MLCFDSFFKKLTLYVSILLIYLDSLPNHGKCQINDIFPFLQWRVNAKLDGRSLLYYELGNSTWSWIWLDRWISGVNDSSKERSKQESKDSWIRGVNDSSKVKTNKESKMKTKEQNTRKKVVLKRPAPVLAKKRVHSKVVDTIKEQ